MIMDVIGTNPAASHRKKNISDSHKKELYLLLHRRVAAVVELNLLLWLLDWCDDAPY